MHLSSNSQAYHRLTSATGTLKSKQYAAVTLGTILSNCTSEDVANYIAPTFRDKFDPGEIDRLCATLTRQFGTYQAIGDLLELPGRGPTEAMLTFNYLAAARYDKGTPVLKITIVAHEKKRYVANITYVAGSDQPFTIPFTAESRQYAAATLKTILNNCTAENATDDIAPALWDKFDPADIHRLCSALSWQFGAYQVLGDLVPLVRYVRDFRTLGMDVYGWLATARYDKGTPLLKIIILRREKKWYVVAVSYAAH